MTKTHTTATRHLAAVTKLAAGAPEILEAKALGRLCVENYTEFWTANVCGRIFLIGKGHVLAPRQYVVWYPNGHFWSSYGTTIASALDGAMQDAWLAQPASR